MYVSTIFLFLPIISGHTHSKYDRELKDKVAVVTGGSSGVGYAITENFLKNGARNVIIIAHNRQRGLLAEKTLKSLYGADRILFIQANVITDLDRVADIICGAFGYVDILVNNAGTLDENDSEKTILTNVLAPVLWSERFFDIMRKDKGGKGGTIVNVASVASYLRDPFFWRYKSSKFAILGLSVGLGHEYNFLTSGVRVFAINPSFTYTNMTKQQMVVDEQVEIFNKFREVLPWQSSEAVGDAAALLYKTATTGMAYTVQGGEIFVSPDSVNITAEFLLSL